MSLLRPLSVALLLSLGLAACTSQTDDDFQNPPPGPPASCTVDPAVAGCSGGSVGYTCAGDRPDDGDTDLVCSDGTPGAAGLTVYCCAPYGQYWSDCTVDTSVPGCVGEAFGFRCSGPESPGAADASLSCSEGAPSGDGDTLYCCNSLTLPPACAACLADGAGCSGCADVSAVEYTCVGGATPAALDAALVCEPGPGDNFCCTPASG